MRVIQVQLYCREKNSFEDNIAPGAFDDSGMCRSEGRFLA
jgi:hypothetical protein